MPGERKTERVAWGLREEETLGSMRAALDADARPPSEIPEGRLA